jgi:hypothetical protein
MCDWGGISGPFTSVEEAAEDVLAMAVGQDCPGFYSAASGALPDAFIAARSAQLVKVGKTFEINGTLYVRTKSGLVAQ